MVDSAYIALAGFGLPIVSLDSSAFGFSNIAVVVIVVVVVVAIVIHVAAIDWRFRSDRALYRFFVS